eukprot:Phypoly_transcript_07285.p1 GENE.Phypoly_transcript_07285~~Phypoly_transcript_07285.p1  ORF type:complete len:492 (-),score=67.76 Phypoly_transcript_07285:95-1570(-)
MASVLYKVSLPRALTPVAKRFCSTLSFSNPLSVITESPVPTETVQVLDPIVSPIVEQSHAEYSEYERTPYWTKVPLWENVTEKEFLTYRWQVSNYVQGEHQLYKFLGSVVPDVIPPLAATTGTEHKTRQEFIEDVGKGMKMAPMSVRLTPHILSLVNWKDPLNDPIRKQFIPIASSSITDHPKLHLDSLEETRDSPVPGLVHRYQHKVLFLATSICPLYCRFCTRSYSVGAETESVKKQKMAPTKKRWEKMLDYIANTPKVHDVVVSGGDSYYLDPEHLSFIGSRLLAIPHVKRFRFASKGLAVCPSRLVDPEDGWCEALISVSDQGRKMGKQVAFHTHFNHPNEITWVTKVAARKLFANGVTTRNQSVFLRGVNNDVETMKNLVTQLADLNIQPYYVYQGDMIRGVEELRTPLHEILNIEKHLRGSIGGFMMPTFVVDLPGGGGKRLASSFESYDRSTGVSKYIAPSVTGSSEKLFEYHDPLWSVPSSSA